MKLISWNLNGIRAVAKKGLFNKIEAMNPDVICFQETKAQDDQVAEVLNDLNGYYFYSNSAIKKGYSGTAILSKTEPLKVFSDIGIEEHDQEGRVLTAEFEQFYLVTVYTPNSKNDLSRLADRQNFDAAFLTSGPACLPTCLSCAKTQDPITKSKPNTVILPNIILFFYSLQESHHLGTEPSPFDNENEDRLVSSKL